MTAESPPPPPPPPRPARAPGTTLHHPCSWRSWRLRLTAALVLSMLVLRLAWGHHARKTLDARLADLRARGEPATLSEVDPGPAVPDAENAYLAYVRAAAAVTVASPRSSMVYPIRDEPPFDGPWLKLAASSETANAPAFAIARSAQALPGAHVRDSTSSPLPSTNLNQLRRLANTLADGAAYAQHLGDDAEAVERLADILAEARALRSDPELISQLVADGLESLASYETLVVAPGVRFAPGEDGVRTPASPAAVRALIARLLDEGPARAQLPVAMRTWRATLVDEQLARAGQGTWLIRPLIDLDGARLVDAATAGVAAASEPTLPAAMSVLATRPPDLLYGDSASPRYSRWFQTRAGAGRPQFHFRTLALRRVAAVSLAARLYRADRAGAWPERLGQLVPAYLPAVPADPLAPGDRPLGYVVRQRSSGDPTPRPMVYFEAGVDRPDLIKPGPMYDWQSESDRGARTVRQYRDLSRFAPPSSP